MGSGADVTGDAATKPQWSPALSAGNGLPLPANHHRGWSGRNGAQPYRLGMGNSGGPPVIRFRVPQWSPALSAGNGALVDRFAYRVGLGRNGAQPYRLGMGSSPSAHGRSAGAPQWSPALSAGNGWGNDGHRSRLHDAAMEPSLIGWEWGSIHKACTSRRCKPQWSPALSAGNGQLERVAEHSGVYPRNGAQPYRLGMGASRSTTCVSAPCPQWSPALSAGNGRSPLTLPLATSLAHVFEHCDPDAETDSLITLALG